MHCSRARSPVKWSSSPTPIFGGTSMPHGPRSGTAPPQAFMMENRGVDTVPLKERTFRPRRIFSVLYGGDLTYSVIIFGSFPIVFGLGWWASVGSVLTGVFIGSLVIAPMSIFAPRTGTNNPVSSGAHFGVAGRFIGTLLALFSALGFVAITIWTSGDALVGTINRITGTATTDLERGLGYAAMIAIVMSIAVRGVHLMTRIQETVMVPVMSLVLLAGLFAFGPAFDPGYAGGTYAFGSFSVTFVASALLMASVVISYGVFIGDWARYINPEVHPVRRVAGATFFGGLVGMGVPILWGVFVASTFAEQAGNFIPALIAESPGWYLIGLVFLGGVAGVAQGTVGLYGTGLDTSSLVPRLSRQQATLLIGAVSVALVYLGTFVWDALAAVNAFLVLLVVVTTPWIVIMTIGYFHRRGYYLADDLQVFTRGQTGGRYWFHKGVNWRATGSWLAGSAVGVLFSAAPPVFTGPWANAADGTDLSLVSGAVAAAVVYTVALRLFPEPGYVFGPDGGRFGMSRSAGVPAPVVASRANDGAPATPLPTVEAEDSI
ncbi:purine-cytosine permease family protein [Streptomyces sp. NPDC004227]